MVTRRQLHVGLGSAFAAAAMLRPSDPAQAQPNSWPQELAHRLAEIEIQCGGRLGVGILDTRSGRTAGHRVDERFPMCSTHKALSAAALLARVDRGQERLDRRVRFSIDQVVPYSPVTKPNAGGEGMTLAAICEAAITLSDNTAGNLILDAIGGPAGFTAYLRELGDKVTRLDRTEPTLNEALPDDPRDTTSPFVMAADLNQLVLGEALSPASRKQLAAWLLANKTGDARLRAGVPPGWRVGDKTGTGDRGTVNDVGLLWPPGRNPVIVTTFITNSGATLDARNTAFASVAQAVVLALGA